MIRRTLFILLSLSCYVYFVSHENKTELIEKGVDVYNYVVATLKEQNIEIIPNKLSNKEVTKKPSIEINHSRKRRSF